MNLKPETLSKIDEVITHYPVKRSATFECALLPSCGFADVTSAASDPSLMPG